MALRALHWLNRRSRGALAAGGLALVPLTMGADARPDPSGLLSGGLTLSPASDLAGLRPVPGPVSGNPGFAAAAAPATLTAQLAPALRGRGSLMFWFRADQAFRSGTTAANFRQRLITLPGAFTVSFQVETAAITLLVEWDGPREEVFEKHIRVILPEFPGPGWHHVAVNWDGAAGEANVFLDGTPYYVPGEKLPPWTVGEATRLDATFGRFPLAGLRVAAEPATAAEVLARVGSDRAGVLAGLLGARDIGPLSADGLEGEVLYHRTLATAADIRDWRIEGPARVAHEDGGLRLSSERPDGPQGHLVAWCPQVFPDRFVAEWDFELLEPKGLCIVFFAAAGRGGRDLFDPSLARRDGVFAQYTLGDIDCYHISYFANTPDVPRAVANLRKNHGFFLLSNGPVGVPVVRPGERHRALLVKDGARIRMAVDGRLVIDYTDDGARAGPVWREGRIGLRQMQWTVARYRDFRVSALRP